MLHRPPSARPTVHRLAAHCGLMSVVVVIGALAGAYPATAQHGGFWSGGSHGGGSFGGGYQGGRGFRGHLAGSNWLGWAEAWAVGATANDYYYRRNERRQDTMTSRSEELELSTEGRRPTARSEAERRQLQDDLQALREERRRLEEASGKAPAAGGPSAADQALPVNRTEWEIAIGEENVRALEALIECDRDRAIALARTAARSENPALRNAGHWIEAVTALDRDDPASAARQFEELVILDIEIASLEEAEATATGALVEIQAARRADGIECDS